VVNIEAAEEEPIGVIKKTEPKGVRVLYRRVM
jgi:hypothetical protein